MPCRISIPVDEVSSYPLGLADDRVLTLSEFAKLAGISPVTLRRRIAAGDGPIITKLSERRLGIRVRHAREWLDARASSNLLEA
jgi:predicted DNA-binding transcriptional regulator AlpA